MNTDVLKVEYAYESWRGTNRLDEELFVWRLSLTGHELAPWSADRVQPIATPGWPPAIQSVWRPRGEGGRAFQLDVFECASRGEAHELLVGLLGEFQAPRGHMARRADAPGDVAFGDSLGRVQVFARANIVSMLRNAGPEVFDVREQAVRLDTMLTTKPDRGAAAPEILRFDAVAEVKQGQAVRLALEAADPLGRPVWFKIFAAGGEIVRENGSLVFRRSGAEPGRVTAFAISPNGSAATRTVAVS